MIRHTLNTLLLIAGIVTAADIRMSRASETNNPFSGARSIEITMHKVETCPASQYGIGDGYNGRRAADGSTFNTWATNPYTVAHKTRRLGSFVTVCSLATSKCIRAKVTDRGPYYHARCVDLGRAGANAIGMGDTGRVSVE